MPPSPPGVTAAAVSARCVASAHSRCLRSPRARSANTAFVTAMNGTPSGTASNGMPTASHAAANASGTTWWRRPAPRPSPSAGTPAASRCAT